MKYYHLHLMERHIVSPVDLFHEEGDKDYTLIFENRSEEISAIFREETEDFRIVVYGLNYALAEVLLKFKDKLWAFVPLGFEIYNYRNFLSSLELIEKLFFLFLKPRTFLSRQWNLLINRSYSNVISSFRYYITAFEVDYRHLSTTYKIRGVWLRHYVFYKKVDFDFLKIQKKSHSILVGNSLSISSNTLSFILKFARRSTARLTIQSAYGDEIYIQVVKWIGRVYRNVQFDAEYLPFKEYLLKLASHDTSLYWNRRPEGLTTLIICVQLGHTVVLNPKSLLCDFMDEIGLHYVKWSVPFNVLSESQKRENLEILNSWLSQTTNE